MSPVEISSDTIIIVNLGVLVTVATWFGRIVYRAAQLELNQKFQKEMLDSAHAKIRDLEKRIINRG